MYNLMQWNGTALYIVILSLIIIIVLIVHGQRNIIKITEKNKGMQPA